VVNVKDERLVLMTQPEEGAFSRTAEASFAEGIALPGAMGRLTLS